MELDDEFLKSLDPVRACDFFSYTLAVPYCDRAERFNELERFFAISLPQFEEQDQDLFLAWNEKGLHFGLKTHFPFTDCFYPDFEKGDSWEIWIDTRDMKSISYVHRFCHHFLILPKTIQGIQGVELTRFRAEEGRLLADPADLLLKTNFTEKNFLLSLFIRKEALFGYDPIAFPRIGFAFRMNRAGSSHAHQFPLSVKDYAIEKHPALWASLNLNRGKA